MRRILQLLLIGCASFNTSIAQDFGDFPAIEKAKLLNDLELLHQGLNKFHSGMYWYTPKDSVDDAFESVRGKLTRDMNVLEFHRLIAPLVALSREDHTDVFLPTEVKKQMNAESKFLPMTIVFLGKELHCVKNGSDYQNLSLEGERIESINGESPISIVEKIGNLFASDGYIKTVKYRDLEGFAFSMYYFYYYGQVDRFDIKFTDIDEPVSMQAMRTKAIRTNFKGRYADSQKAEEPDLLEYKTFQDSIAYLGIHSFSNGDIKEESREKSFKRFLENSFRSIDENGISTLIIDVSKNGGGSEGNEGLLYSYLGDNYRKYIKVRTKTQEAILDNGVDKPIKLKTFGLLERIFVNKRMADGSLERKEGRGHGLMAYKKEPKYKYAGKLFVLISPVTYSGGSEFSNMLYTNELATFVGQETGGGYLGNTSGYSERLILPNSGIEIDIPALQFVMNVEPTLPFGSGVIPDFEVIPTFEQYLAGGNASLSFVLELVKNEN